MSRETLIQVINDTIDKCENEYSWMIEDAHNIFYDDKFFTYDKFIKKFTSTAHIKIVKQTTVETIIDNGGKVFGVLNFASAKNPGGGVLKGTVAQEEALARASSLYPMIKQCTQFYTPTEAPYYTDKIIYTKPVYVFKDDYGYDIDPIKCEVITCAAPNYNMYSLFDKPYGGGGINIEEHKKVMTRRFVKVLKSAIANNQRNLILGAWGCGVFKNPADINAQIFREVLDYFSNYFDEVIFAIPDDINYNIFKDNLFSLGYKKTS